MSDNKNQVLTLEDFLGGGEDISTNEAPETTPIEDEILPPQPEVEDEVENEEEDETPSQPEIENEEEEKPTPEPNSSQPSFYDDLKNDFLESGDWEDVVLEIDGEEVELSSIENLDRDTFLQIKESQKQLAEEKRKEKYIDIDGLSETDLKLIKMKKSGEDWTELLRQEAEIVHPLEGLDLEDENIQTWLLSEQYRSQGMSPEAIQIQIATDKKNFEVDSKAKKVIDNINGSYKTMVDNKAKEAEAKLQEKQEAHKNLVKGVREAFKGLEVKDTAAKRYVETATKQDKDGKTKLDSLIEEVKKDPNKLAKLAFYLEDEEGYLQFNGAKKTNKEKLKTIKIISETARKDKDIAKNNQQDKPKSAWDNMTFIKPK